MFWNKQLSLRRLVKLVFCNLHDLWAYFVVHTCMIILSIILTITYESSLISIQQMFTFWIFTCINNFAHELEPLLERMCWMA